MSIALSAAGGLAIFLLAMGMMTGGLKMFGGAHLKRHLERWTSSPLRGVATGALVTALVQSSSAVTVATIGFVNAGILSLRHSLGVVFGASIGTTMTGWLVSLVGFGFKIDSFALPIIALGVALRLAVRNKRLHGLGEALAGFGLFFLGLSILKDAFAGMAATFETTTLASAGSDAGGVLLFVLIGLAATLLTQSSSAAIAVILTAAGQSAIGLGAAGAAIIGASIGTTSTAALAAIGATPNARRVAAGFVLCNLSTGLAALAILPVLLWAAAWLGDVLGLPHRPAVVLALFHTVFTVTGVALLLPFIGGLARFLQRHFTTAEEDIGRPRHLDRTVAATPALAVSALEQELRRMHDQLAATALAAVAGAGERAGLIERRAAAMRQLGQAVLDFAVEVRMENMSRDDAEALARLLRIARYLDEAAQLLAALHAAGMAGHRLGDEATRVEVLEALAAAQACLTRCAAPSQTSGEAPGPAADIPGAHDAFEVRYQAAKAAVLRAAALRRLPLDDADSLLDALSSTRRLLDQIVKATLMLQKEAPPLRSAPADDAPESSPAPTP